MKLLCGVVVVGAVLLAVAEVGAISLYDVVSTTRLMLLLYIALKEVSGFG